MAPGKLPAGWEGALRRAIAFHETHRRITVSDLNVLLPPKEEVTSGELENFWAALADQGIHPVDDE